MKKAIAMKCNQEQFDTIKPKLKYLTIKYMEPFDEVPYLINNLSGINGLISNTAKHKAKDYNRTVFETWNEKVFLEACGIEVEETFVITREQIIDIAECSNSENKLRLLFPSAFEPEKKELVVGVWYRRKDFGNFKFCFNGSYGQMSQYGFDRNGDWSKQLGIYEDKEYIEATQQEVEEALKAEILKRYKVGDRVNCLKYGNLSLNCELNLDSFDHYFEDDELWVSFDEGEETDSMVCVYSNGIFAEIIRPKKMTQAEIETELGYNIEIV